MTIRVIHSMDETNMQDEPMFWSNEFGWTNLDQADVTMGDDYEQLDLPVGGEWMDYCDAKDEIDSYIFA